MQEFTVKVTNIVDESIGVKSFKLTPTHPSNLNSYTAGAHIDVHLGQGLIRQYSLYKTSGSSDSYHIAVLKDPTSRGGSLYMHTQVKVGEELVISQPRNHFALSNNAKHYVLIAGGIGITPILCMAEQLYRENKSFEMHYCMKSKEHGAFVDYLLSSPYQSSINVYFDETNRINLHGVLSNYRLGTEIYTCGPEGLISTVYDIAATLSIPAEAIHREFFQNSILKNNDGDKEFIVFLQKRQLEFHIPSTKTVLEVLLENNIDIDCSCEQGVCGTCLTTVLSGEIDHRDSYLTDAEKGSNTLFTPCCSRAKSEKLVLDL